MNFIKEHAQQQVDYIKNLYNQIDTQIKTLDFKTLEFELINETDDGDDIRTIQYISVDGKDEYEDILDMDEGDPIAKLIENISDLYSDSYYEGFTLKITKDFFNFQDTELFT